MPLLNIEIKARCLNPAAVRQVLQAYKARFVGEDHQVDTYFNVAQGRLKLREGRIENALIYYRRSDQTGPKRSDVWLYRTGSDPSLKAVLTAALGVRVVVDKRREIYFVDNVKFHVDGVEGLGAFVEIEAIDAEGTLGKDRLQEQCDHFIGALGIRPEDLIPVSYSDLLLAPGRVPG